MQNRLGHSAVVLERPHGGITEVTVITWWASLDAVRAFAGERLDTAVVSVTTNPSTQAVVCGEYEVSAGVGPSTTGGTDGLAVGAGPEQPTRAATRPAAIAARRAFTRRAPPRRARR